jgi:hypothetical protein
MYYLILYALLGLVVLLLIAAAYIKITMRFWSMQPVFHVYDVWYWLRPPGVIQKSLPAMNKYTNVVNIKTFNLAAADLTPVLPILEDACAFIKAHYIPAQQVVQYSPTPQNILAYLSNANYAAFLSVYQKPTLPSTVAAVVTARPLNVTRKKTKEIFATYYVDNLCVAPSERKRGLAPQMIQTLTYHLRLSNPQIQTCLFKRERDLTAIVPLVLFESECYQILPEWLTYGSGAGLPGAGLPGAGLPGAGLPGGITCIEIASAQLSLFMSFLNEHTQRFEWFVLPDLSNFATLIKTENLFVYGLLQAGELLAVYVFRNTEIFYSHQTKTPQKALECIATICAGHCALDVFAQGLRAALRQIYARRAFGYVLLETTADAAKLRPYLPQMQFSVPSAFYFYNYGCYTATAANVLLVY